MSKANKPYRLMLHETVVDRGWSVTRVPGGWIYRRIGASDMCFVPLSGEFYNGRS